MEAVPGARFIWALKQVGASRVGRADVAALAESDSSVPLPSLQLSLYLSQQPLPVCCRQDAHAHLPPALAGPLTRDSRVLVLPWAPQAAILGHPAAKLFVTHGGLGSLYEGLSAGLPLVALPFFADQHINAQHPKNRQLGTAVRVGFMALPVVQGFFGGSW
jgi:hypothetical protein